MTDTSSEEHRMACEARHVLTLPITERREYLRGADEKRGAAAGKALREAVKVEWERRRKAGAMELQRPIEIPHE